MAYPRYQAARAFKFSTKTTAGPSLTTSWANLDTATDLTLAAQVGDVIEVGVRVPWANQGDFGIIDVATIVGGSVVNYFGGASGAGSGDGMMFTSNAANYHMAFSQAWRTLVAGDITAGTVTLRVRARNAGSKQLNIGASDPFQFSAKNLGPADPN